MPERFHPAVRAWFGRTFAAPTDAQVRAWPEILEGRDVLVAAPTGSGKTLAAFLASLDALFHAACAGTLGDTIEVVYVSPLKALSADVEKNLLGPLEGIGAVARELGFDAPAVRAALRTGDSSTAARAAIVRTPPHILVTTPESLYLMLTARRTRELLRSVKTVIVDEVHALMRDKRGSHLALSLARLDAVASRPQRVGLSATVRPIEEAARFLSGVRAWDRERRASVGERPPATLVDVGHRRALDLAVEVPTSELGSVATHEQWGEIYDRVATLIGEHTTTLVFVNTRRQAERIAHHLAERVGEEAVSAHHGSLSKERRLQVEARLKAGSMRAIVATASLELGIDVGSVDLVAQIGSPRSMSALLQRIGRSGHGLGRTAQGRLFPTSRDDLVECAALVRGVRKGSLDRTEPPVAPIDVLAQQIVAECASEDWPADQLFELVRTAAPYMQLTRETFDRVVTMVGEGVAPRAGRTGALLHVDRIHGVLRARRAARMIAIENGGAIPEVADYRVLLDPDDTFVGTVNEDWAIESSAGDVFLLGTHAWRVRRVESRSGVMRVVDAAGAPPSVPFWLGEAPARTWEHSLEVSELRKEIVGLLDRGEDAARQLGDACGLCPSGASELVRYVAAQRDALGVMPTVDDVVFERFFDEAGGMQVVVHAPFGGRVNRAFGLALRKRFCMSFDFELQAAATDDAVLLSLGTAHSFPLEDAFRFVRSADLDTTLQQAALRAPMFGVRWKWNVGRALAVLRRARGKKIQPFIQRMRSDDLLAAVFPAQVGCQENATGPIEVPDHPLVQQTLLDCFTEVMDKERFRGLLERMERGELRMHARDTTEPSPFSHEILGSKPYAFLDDAPLEERRARAVSLRRSLPESQRDLGALDASAIERVAEQARPEPRSAEELHELLLSLLAAPLEPSWAAPFDALVAAGRALRVETPAGQLAAAAESADALAAVYGGERAPAELREEALARALRGFAEVSGPFTASAFARRLGVDLSDALIAAGKLESEGAILRGSFTPGRAPEVEPELCDRRILSRIHRATMDRLRSEIEPVSAQDFMRFLFDRHQLSPRVRAGGRAGLRDAVGRLHGFEIAASAWEEEVLPARVGGYQPDWLDELCFSGEVGWARLSPKVAGADALGSPSRATPISLFLREDLPLLLEAIRGKEAAPPPSFAATSAVLDALQRRGALFLHDLAAITGLSKHDVAQALWDLIGRGLATADGFQPLRELLGGRGAARRTRAPQGRFALVEPHRPFEGSAEALADRVAEQLLARYGVVFRDLVARESFTVPWRDVVRALRRRELRGLVRGGRFVAGFVGEQFALPECVDGLRRVRRTERTGELVRVSAVDPLNLVGILLPGPRVPAVAGTTLSFRDGAFIAAGPPGTDVTALA
ncbi:MAG: DEAD/DEAH box helicase [Polyangiaceae bacterium]|nr:DEAD/DEAH box helicase [Polyangiaceae bacterium]